VPDLSALVAHADSKRRLILLLSLLLVLVLRAFRRDVASLLADEALPEGVVLVLFGLLHRRLFDEKLL